MKNTVILENIRSAYNVWNIIRTADALWWDVWIVWYTPHPDEQSKVTKTSLWAEKNVWLKRFDYTKDAIEYAKSKWFNIFAWEITQEAVSLSVAKTHFSFQEEKPTMLILWNEVDWVLAQTLKLVDNVIYIPMQWIKESLNVWQTAAIFMRELK